MPVNYRGELDAQLSNISVAFTQEADAFIAQRVFPTLPVRKSSDTFTVYPRGWFLRDQVRERPLGGEPAEATYGLRGDTYAAKEYALAMTLDDRERANVAEGIDPEETHVEFLTEQHLIHADRQWADAYFAPGVWSTELTGVAAAPADDTEITFWNDPSSNPQRDVNRLKMRQARLTGRPGNVLVIGAEAYVELQNHPSIIDRLKYTTSEAVTRQILARYFEVDEILVPMATHNIAPELAPQLGDNVDLEFIVNPFGLLLLYRTPRVGIKIPTAGITFVWTGILGGGGFPMPVYTDRKKRAFSDWFAVRSAYDMKVVSPDLGVYCDEIVPRA